MDKNEITVRDILISEQQIDIRHLTEVNNKYKEALDEIHNLLVCCGGPLNDNFQQYSKEQLKIFFKIDSLSTTPAPDWI